MPERCWPFRMSPPSRSRTSSLNVRGTSPPGWGSSTYRPTTRPSPLPMRSSSPPPPTLTPSSCARPSSGACPRSARSRWPRPWPHRCRSLTTCPAPLRAGPGRLPAPLRPGLRRGPPAGRLRRAGRHPHHLHAQPRPRARERRVHRIVGRDVQRSLHPRPRRAALPHGTGGCGGLLRGHGQRASRSTHATTTSPTPRPSSRSTTARP